MSNDLNSKLKIDTKQFNKGLKDSTGKLKRWSTSASSQFKSVGSAIKRMMGPILAVGAGLAAIVALPMAAFAKASAGLAEALDKVGKVSSNLDIDTGFFQSLQIKAELSGLEVSNLDQLFRRVIRSASDAAQGSKKAADAYAVLGVKVEKANGELKNADDLFLEVGNSLSQVENATDRAALSMEIFGRNGADLAVLFAGGSAELIRFKEAAEELGLLIPEETIRRVELLNDELVIMKKLTAAAATEGIEAATQLSIRWEQFTRVLVNVGAFFTNLFGGMVENAISGFGLIQKSFSWLFNTAKTGYLDLKATGAEWLAAHGVATEALTKKAEALRAEIEATNKAYKEAQNQPDLVKKLIAGETAKRTSGGVSRGTGKVGSAKTLDSIISPVDAQRAKLEEKAALDAEKRIEAANRLAESLKPATEQLLIQFEAQAKLLANMEEGAEKQAAMVALAQKYAENMKQAELDEFTAKYGKLVELSEQFGDELGTAIVDSFGEGQAAFEKFAKSFLTQMTQMILKAALLAAIQAATGGGAGFGAAFSSNFAGGFAKGGFVPPNKVALVGEKGPELIRTGGSGASVTPNSALGGDVNVSIENSGTAKNVNATFDDKNNVLRIVMDDLQAGGPLSRIVQTKR